jgi:uncharacterized protein (TIGR00369 family)
MLAPEDQAGLGSERYLVLTHLMQPAEANYMGTIHGGIIMKLIDEAAAACAYRYCRAHVTTAAIDRIDFHHPVQIGDLVRLAAHVNHAGHTSMEIGVRVAAENLRSGIVTHTNSAYLVLVAIDEDGRPIPVPAFLPATPEETAWFAAAQERRRQRLRLRERGTRG